MYVLSKNHIVLKQIVIPKLNKYIYIYPSFQIISENKQKSIIS